MIEDKLLRLADSLEEEVTARSGLGKSMRRRRNKKPAPKKWLGCEKPKRGKTRSGKRVWKTSCVYVNLKTKRVGVFPRIVSYQSRAPRKFTIGGKPARIVPSYKKLLEQAHKKYDKKKKSTKSTSTKSTSPKKKSPKKKSPRKNPNVRNFGRKKKLNMKDLGKAMLFGV